MAQPKSKISRSRRGMRRSHITVKTETPSVCPTTGELHRPNRAFKASDGAIYYKGKIIKAAKED